MKTLTLLLFSALAITSAQAAVIGYSFAWTGSAGYTMGGSFTFDSASIPGGTIVASELLSFSATGYLNGNPVGTFSLASPYHGADPFNFNFNPLTVQFPVGGNSTSPTGQNWNDDGNIGNTCGTPGVGFNAGNLFEDLCVNGLKVSTASATTPITIGTLPVNPPPVNGVPEPATGVLIGLSLAAAATLKRVRTLIRS